MPFLRSSCLRFVCELARCSSSSLGAGAVVGADGGAAGGDGEDRRGGGVGECCEAVMYSSHVDVARSSSRRLLGLGAGAGSVQGENNMVRYCWMMGLSFFPSWKALSPSLKAAPAIIPYSTFVPSYVASTTTALCFCLVVSCCK